ncbi:unnamed protein product, partial [Vitis vinifera]|uniref:Uncharacterized protein n=1 Tax=Vitis vinifera TaxID=29760 RepID=D7T0P4_VITVI
MLILVMGAPGSCCWWSWGGGGAVVPCLLIVGGDDGGVGGVCESGEGGGLPCPEKGRGGC